LCGSIAGLDLIARRATAFQMALVIDGISAPIAVATGAFVSWCSATCDEHEMRGKRDQAKRVEDIGFDAKTELDDLRTK